LIHIVNETGVGRDTQLYDVRTGLAIKSCRSVEIKGISVHEMVTARVELVLTRLNIIAHEPDIDRLQEAEEREAQLERLDL